MIISKQLLFVLLIASSLLSAQNLLQSDCEADNENIACCFAEMPAALSSTMTIGDQREEGKRMIVRGTVMKSDGKTPYASVILYAYHTNAKGIYPKRGNEKGIRKRHGYLHGWLKTDSLGQYEIRSIRPEPYPSWDTPAHVHIVVKEPNGKMYYINDIVFSDDPFVNERYIASLRDRRDNGIVTLKRNNNGVLEGTRTMILK
ncbi:MAG: intradiol ring-cleavage dioxygenase [Ignavibacteriales bacterium]|nr:intradiol ring-cleavage dioxygenase [Ignavibacteriales bacterium]